MITNVEMEGVVGRQIEFKKSPGKGRPALAKALAESDDSIVVQLNDGRLDEVRREHITKVIRHRGRAPLTELERFAAVGFLAAKTGDLAVA